MAEKIEVLVDGGKATPGPPLGPALGPLGVNVVEIVAAVNAKTKAFAGMKIPVKILIDRMTKKFEIEVGTPPASALILKELGMEKGSGSPKATKVGNLSAEKILKISEMKQTSMLGKTKRDRFMEIVGTCVSMGVTVDGKDPRDIRADIEAGKYDKLFAS